MNGRRLGAMPKPNTEIKRGYIMEKFFTINLKRNMKTMIYKKISDFVIYNEVCILNA